MLFYLITEGLGFHLFTDFFSQALLIYNVLFPGLLLGPFRLLIAFSRLRGDVIAPFPLLLASKESQRKK